LNKSYRKSSIFTARYCFFLKFCLFHYMRKQVVNDGKNGNGTMFQANPLILNDQVDFQ
jgi:hypothetical protein